MNDQRLLHGSGTLARAASLAALLRLYYTPMLPTDLCERAAKSSVVDLTITNN